MYYDHQPTLTSHTHIFLTRGIAFLEFQPHLYKNVLGSDHRELTKSIVACVWLLADSST